MFLGIEGFNSECFGFKKDLGRRRLPFLIRENKGFSLHGFS